MSRQKILRIALTATVSICIVLYVVRVIEVNASYSQQGTISFSLNDAATYAGENSSGGEVDCGDISIMANSARLLDYDQVRDAVPGFTDQSIEQGSASDLRALVIDVSAINNSNILQKVHLRDFRVQSDAWSNGLYVDLFFSLNDIQSTIVEMRPCEELHANLVYLMYDTQFNSASDWSKINERSFDLVLSLYPIKYVIDVGRPE